MYSGVMEKMMVGKLWQIIPPSGWLLCLLLFIFISYAVSLQIATLARTMLSTLETGYASQTTP